MPVKVVFECEVCAGRPGAETQAGLERQLLDLRHGEYVDVEPERWLVWHGRGIYGPTRYACGNHRGELKAMLREEYGNPGLAPVGDGAASVARPARHRPGARAREEAAVRVRSGLVARSRAGDRLSRNGSAPGGSHCGRIAPRGRPGGRRGGAGHQALSGRQERALRLGARAAAARCTRRGRAQAAREVPRVPAHRSLEAGARADRGHRGRPRLLHDRVGGRLQVHARPAAPPARSDRDGQPRHGQLGRDQLPAPAGGQGRVPPRGRPLRAQARRRGQRLRHGRRGRRPRRGARQAEGAAGGHLRRLLRDLLLAGLCGPPPRAGARRGARRRLRGGGL